MLALLLHTVHPKHQRYHDKLDQLWGILVVLYVLEEKKLPLSKYDIIVSERIDYRREEKTHNNAMAPTTDDTSSPKVLSMLKFAKENKRCPTTPPIIPKKRFPKHPLLFPF